MVAGLAPTTQSSMRNESEAETSTWARRPALVGPCQPWPGWPRDRIHQHQKLRTKGPTCGDVWHHVTQSTNCAVVEVEGRNAGSDGSVQVRKQGSQRISTVHATQARDLFWLEQDEARLNVACITQDCQGWLLV